MVDNDSWKPSALYFDRQIYIANSSIEECLLQLKNETIDYVLNGCEKSVEIAEQLIHKLTPQYSVDLSSSNIRSQKYLQQISLEQHGLPAIKQIQVNRNKIELQLLDTLTYPVFCKPSNGLGSIGVFKATSGNDVLTQLKTCPTKTALSSID